jgi:hypothetical protein
VIQIAHELLVQRARGGEDGEAKRSMDVCGAGVRMNMSDRESFVAIDESGLLIQTRHPTQWGGVRANVAITAGMPKLPVLRYPILLVQSIDRAKQRRAEQTNTCTLLQHTGQYYYEATVTDEGLARVGWSSKAAKLELGTCVHGFGYGGTAKKSHKKQFENYGEPYGLGDTIGCFLDADAGTIHFSKNGMCCNAIVSNHRAISSVRYYRLLTSIAYPLLWHIRQGVPKGIRHSLRHSRLWCIPCCHSQECRNALQLWCHTVQIPSTVGVFCCYCMPTNHEPLSRNGS